MPFNPSPYQKLRDSLERRTRLRSGDKTLHRALFDIQKKQQDEVDAMRAKKHAKNKRAKKSRRKNRKK